MTRLDRLAASSRRCEWSRRQWATVCGNLEQSGQFVINRIIIPYRATEPSVAGPGSVAAVERLGLYICLQNILNVFSFYIFVRRRQS